MGPPLVVGLGGRASASSPPTSPPPALHARLPLPGGRRRGDGDARARTRSSTATGKPVTREPQQITWDPVQAEKGGYRHFMLKEIHEQPRAVRDTLLGPDRARGGRSPPGGARGRGRRAEARQARDAARLRHELARRPGRQVPAGAGRGHPGRGRLRQRVPLPHAARGPRDPRRGHHARAARPRTPWPPSARPSAWAPCPSRSATCRARR